jgi:uncharacterized protein YbgA (DUF1722 family)/uncharacterized protein YbbK (DUF523 family)
MSTMDTAADDSRPRVGISSCLLGESVRYDGGHKRDRFITDVLGTCIEWVPVCPEVEVGMGVPRPSIRLEGKTANPRLVEPKGGEDWTERMAAYNARRLRQLGELKLSGYILKKDSPTCGMERVRVYPESGGAPERSGRGLFAAALLEAMPLLPVEEEGRLNDLPLRENFIERVFGFHRWQKLCAERKSRGRLVEFHAAHKLLILAHSEKHLRVLGRLVAGMKGRALGDVYDTYGAGLMEALAERATRRRHVNVLQHIMGHFTDRLEPGDRAQLLAELEDYRRGLVPLVVPVTLMRHYVRKFEVSYIQGQVYLNPHPKELLLRNHV